jgi:hypothetical protein
MADKLTSFELRCFIYEHIMGWTWRQWKPEPWPYPIPVDCKSEIGQRFLRAPDNLGMTDPADSTAPIRPEKYEWDPPNCDTDRNAAALVVRKVRDMNLQGPFVEAMLASVGPLHFLWLVATPREICEAVYRAVGQGSGKK